MAGTWKEGNPKDPFWIPFQIRDKNLGYDPTTYDPKDSTHIRVQESNNGHRWQVPEFLITVKVKVPKIAEDEAVALGFVHAVSFQQDLAEYDDGVLYRNVIPEQLDHPGTLINDCDSIDLGGWSRKKSIKPGKCWYHLKGAYPPPACPWITLTFRDRPTSGGMRWKLELEEDRVVGLRRRKKDTHFVLYCVAKRKTTKEYIVLAKWSWSVMARMGIAPDEPEISDRTKNVFLTYKIDQIDFLHSKIPEEVFQGTCANKLIRMQKSDDGEQWVDVETWNNDKQEWEDKDGMVNPITYSDKGGFPFFGGSDEEEFPLSIPAEAVCQDHLSGCPILLNMQI